ncbi:MFS transporter [Flavobacterium agricola]|uniref:MFS transporter n=1 Tax=Flavobacterium agricola TaxID=2870839 RepID=A0ABY6M5C1_9FLAO|nr:MFS transporter [Flavobacterium agricola]UYW02543.1 MFS transporter [Flavobacterium agricola]
MQNLPKGSKKLLNAWAFYDWANSVYSLVIASAIFPIFYGMLFSLHGSDYIDLNGITFKSTALISFVTAFAFLTVAILSPILSGIADFTGSKKGFMQFFCWFGALCTMGLYWFSLENIYFSLFLYYGGLIGFWGSLVFYNSYLPDIAFTEQQDAVSAKGYSMGYIGSVLLMLVNLVMVMKPDFFGIQEATPQLAAQKGMRIAFITVGVWWIVFAQYSFKYLPVFASKGKVTKNVVWSGVTELKKVWKSLQHTPVLKKYLVAFFVYSMAVQTVMLVATYFGEQEIAWANDEQKTVGLIVSILLIQIVAVVGAVLTAKLSAKVGNVKALIFINTIWLVICLVAYWVTLPVHFYITAAFVGLVMGGIQSLSRSTYSKFLPDTQDTTSFFSFYDVTEKVGIVIGMLIYGAIDQITGSMRNAIVFLMVFFAVGIYLLLRVKKWQKANNY